MNKPNIAVLIPCFNEQTTIGQVVSDFKQALPQATIYVYDNRSTDGTSKAATLAGATVRYEPLAGKGNVVKRMFADISADIYVLVDGDATYEAKDAPTMVEMLQSQQLDMVTGVRCHTDNAAYRAGHQLGNKLITGSVKKLFGDRISDLLSGYRVFSRRFVKSLPVFSRGFEIETEFSVHALSLNLPHGELKTNYCARPEGSESKLSTYKDGLKISRLIFRLMRDHRPRLFFGSIALIFLLLALIFGTPVITEYMHTGLVPRLPTAVLSASLVILSFMAMSIGVILHPIARMRKELKMLHYLSSQQ